jgi:hypothetical protein
MHMLHTTEPRDKRDADILRSSTIVIFVEPGPPGAKALRATAVAAGRAVINVRAPTRKKVTNAPMPLGKKRKRAAQAKTIINVPAVARRKVTSGSVPTGKKRKRTAQPSRHMSNMASYGPYEEREARIAELLRKVNQPESLVDTWR